MRIVTIMQARTSSSRLPAKALMPVRDYPSAVLATLRAANRRGETIFATSDDPSDDELARLAGAHGLSVFRGPLHDVLSRFSQACGNLPENCIVIRLTADNLIPDGGFVDELAQAFVSSGTEYLATDSMLSGVPYGLSGEAFSVATLRRAHHEATDASDREHVGPWIKRNCSATFFRPQALGTTDYSHLRCTIDDEEDYRRILRLFENVADPVGLGWPDLLRRLVSLQDEPKVQVPCRVVEGRARSAITLGAAQLGMEYGVVNDYGQPTVEQAVAIVRAAVTHGITALDTARAYGTSEEVVGKALSGSWSARAEVITKLDLSGLPADATVAEVRSKVDNSIALSCQALGMRRLAVVLLHRWQDHDAWNGAAWRRLLELQEAGAAVVLGASVYEPREAFEAIEDPAIGRLQIPLNVLDWRWEAAGFDRAASSRPEVVVHARSALLQGVLAHSPNRWPMMDGARALECSRILERLARDFGRESVTDLCLAYPRSLPWVTSVVVGCETMDQLEENVRLSGTAPLTREQCERLRLELPQVPENFLNPSKWNLKHEYSTNR